MGPSTWARQTTSPVLDDLNFCTATPATWQPATRTKPSIEEDMMQMLYTWIWLGGAIGVAMSAELELKYCKNSVPGLSNNSSWRRHEMKYWNCFSLALELAPRPYFGLQRFDHRSGLFNNCYMYKTSLAGQPWVVSRHKREIINFV
jgi:hypothetical protein